MNLDIKNVTLRSAMNGLEDAIVTLSGPALAISGIIAGVDLVTGGHVFSVAWLTLAWAICLLISLDFQVLALGARVHHVYLADKRVWRKIVEIALAVLIAAAISYVSIQMQSIIARSNGAGISIDAATVQLGINPIWLTWERSALVLVLIFMSGLFRSGALTPAQSEQPQAPAIDLATIIAELDAHHTQRLAELAHTLKPTPVDMADLLDELDRRSQARIEVLMQSVTQTVTRVAIEQITTQIPTMTASIPAIVEARPARREPSVPFKSAAKDTETREQIRQLLAADPEITSRKAGELVGCSHTTAANYLREIRQEQAA